MQEQNGSNGKNEILVIDDKPKIRRIISKRLKPQGFEVREAKNGVEGINEFKSRSPDLVLLDVMMPEKDGKEVLSEIRQQYDRVDLPVIMLSANTEAENVAKALESGANDFLKKPIDFKIASARINTHLELKKSQEKIRELARRDDMTDLFNRRVFLEKVRQEIKRADRYGQTFSVVMVDLDHFKRVNDDYGHMIGDKVLREFARLMQERTRDVDIAGRYGGEEFCLALPETDIDEAFELAERLRKIVEDYEFTKGISLTCSMGISCYENNGNNAESLLDQADKALYISKREGRNQTTVKY